MFALPVRWMTSAAVLGTALVTNALLPVLRAASSSALPQPVVLQSEGSPEVKSMTASQAAAVYPFLPSADKNTGGAVLIVPGVPFDGRSADNEAVQLALWLNEHGIAGFVFRPAAKVDDTPAATAEVNRAVRLLRAQATKFQISPRRIAALGFGRGAELLSDTVYMAAAGGAAPGANPEENLAGRPDLVALVWGARVPATIPANSPPTFLVGSTRTEDGMSGIVDLWTKLRSARVSVDAHFFAKADATAGIAAGNPSLSAWPESFFVWSRFNGFLTDQPRVPIKGMVYLDGRLLPHGYVIFTPVDFVGAGPIVGRVLNSNANIPLGQFSVPAGQGPIAGRYKVDVRQNMNRWLSNSFSGGLVGGRGATPTPEQMHFGHHRVLAPSIDDQRSYTKVRPSDSQEYIVEVKPGAEANLDLKIEVFSK
jgi:hypothetical protein